MDLDPEAALLAEREKLLAADPWTRVSRANEVISKLQAAVTDFSHIRRAGLDELISSGNKQADIAKRTNMTPARLSKLLSSGPGPEWALLGSGALTVVVGGKSDSSRASSPQAVISHETLAAYNLIRETAQSYGLDTKHEVVPPPGIKLKLNRPNLIVLTSPRLLPLVGQVLEADPNLAFDEDDDGWYLADRHTGVTYRSPSDNNDPRDVAYVGRLPRPDGKGDFLYLAGVHAMGTLGAAKYLTEHIHDLHQEVKNRRWSTLVEVRYDAESREIHEIVQLTPVYTA